MLVIDDSPLACKMISDALAFDDQVEVVGTAHDGLVALELIEKMAPDVITLDMRMPHLDGAGVLDALEEMPRRPGVVVIAAAADGGELCLRGVNAVVHKRAMNDDERFDLLAEIIGAVESAVRGRRTVSSATWSR